MANIPMKTLRLHGLDDTYTIPTAPEHIGAVPALYNHGNSNNGLLGYILLAKLEVAGHYVDRPLVFEIVNRGLATPTHVYIRFQNTSSLDPNVDVFMCNSTYTDFIIYKESAGVWQLCAGKNGNWDGPDLIGVHAGVQGVEISYPKDLFIEEAPQGAMRPFRIPVNEICDSFGLGESASTVIDSYHNLNNYKKNGTYHFSYPDGATWGGVWFKEASVEVVSSGDNCITQILRPVGTATKLVRVWDGNAWGEKEVENPPMVPGMEYRTTERWNGKTVWKIALDFGALPNASQKHIATPIDGLDDYVRFFLKTNDGKGNHRYIAGSSDGISIHVLEGWKLVVATTADYSGLGGTFEIHYTKH